MPGVACADELARSWLGSARAVSVRLAAAHWARARSSLARQQELTSALATCAKHDASPHVRAACAADSHAPPAPLAAHDCGGVCGLLLSGGFVLVSFPDAAGDPSWPRVGNIGVELPAHAPYGRE